MWPHFGVLYSVALIDVSVLPLVLCCLDYCHYPVSLEIRYGDVSSTFSFLILF